MFFRTSAYTKSSSRLRSSLHIASVVALFCSMSTVGCTAPTTATAVTTTTTANASATPAVRIAAAPTSTPAKAQATKPTRKPKSLRVFFIGNSVTDTVSYDKLGELAKSRGNGYEYGRHMIPGSPLFLLWNATSGFTSEKYGTSQNALAKFPWDAISLQPFDRGIFDAKEGDLTIISKYIKLAQAQNPDVQIYIYERWPRMYMNGKGASYDKNDYDPSKPGSGVDVSKIDDYTKQWKRPYNEGSWWDGSNETRSYFETLLKEVRKANPTLKKKPLVVPVGEVMNNIQQEMKAGKVPGYTSIYNFYKDGIHLNQPGSYLVACTFYATIYRENPIGLPYELYGLRDPKLAKAIQHAVWKTVTAYPYSGVRAQNTAAPATKAKP